MRRLAVSVVSMAALAGLVPACGGGSSSYGDGGNPPPACTADTATATTSVAMMGTAFVPSCVKVTSGATITFHNGDTMAHTATTDALQPQTFNSDAVAPGTDYTTPVLTPAETLHIHCTFHAGMTATIIVQ